MSLLEVRNGRLPSREHPLPLEPSSSVNFHHVSQEDPLNFYISRLKIRVHLHETVKWNESEQRNSLSQYIVQSCRLRRVLKLLHELQGRGYLVLLWGEQRGRVGRVEGGAALL